MKGGEKDGEKGGEKDGQCRSWKAQGAAARQIQTTATTSSHAVRVANVHVSAKCFSRANCISLTGVSKPQALRPLTT